MHSPEALPGTLDAALGRIHALEREARRVGQAQDNGFIAKLDKAGRVWFFQQRDDYDVNGRRKSWSEIFAIMVGEARKSVS